MKKKITITEKEIDNLSYRLDLIEGIIFLTNEKMQELEIFRDEIKNNCLTVYDSLLEVRAQIESILFKLSESKWLYARNGSTNFFN